MQDFILSCCSTADLTKEHFEERNINYICMHYYLDDVHPNTALIIVDGAGGKHLEVEAASIGGGRIMIHKLDGVEANFTAENPTIIIHNQDTPGHVAKVTNMLAVEDINIATMHLYRGDKRDGYAVMVIETDQPVPEQAVKDLETLSGILKVIYVNKNE